MKIWQCLSSGVKDTFNDLQQPFEVGLFMNDSIICDVTSLDDFHKTSLNILNTKSCNQHCNRHVIDYEYDLIVIVIIIKEFLTM